MYAQFFGNYLLSHGITKEQLMHAMQEANNEHPKLGTLAMHAGYMSASEVDPLCKVSCRHMKTNVSVNLPSGKVI